MPGRMSSGRKLPVFLTGPTGSGKSDVALELAARIGGEIVCADAFQCYRGMEILTAQPRPADRERVPHHLYGTVDPAEEMDAARFAEMAEAALAEIAARGRVAIVCGGSGLYVKALTHGMSPLPPADPEIRSRLEGLPAPELAEMLAQLDPVSARQLNPRNPRHLIRAIEICLLAGRPASELKQSWGSPRPGVRGVFLIREKEDLHDRINRRTEAMAAGGVLEEVSRLQDGSLSVTASKAIGLREFLAALDGAVPLAEAIAAVQVATRQYAKRQITWFRKEIAFVPLPVGRDDSRQEIAASIARLFRLAET